MQFKKISIAVIFASFCILGCRGEGVKEGVDEHGHGHGEEEGHTEDEGRTTLSDESVKMAGIEVEKAGEATIATSVTLNGRVVPDKQRVTRLTARFPGVVKELRKLPGAKIEKGDVLATIEANESLKVYDLVSPRSGEVLDINTAVGEAVDSADFIATVGDLTAVWVELSVPRSDFSKLKVGQKAIVHLDSDSEGKGKDIEGRITYLSSLADGDSQTRLARAEVPNLDRFLIPELFLETKVIIRERTVPVAIKAEALQTFRDRNVVFKRTGNVFEAVSIELGEADGDYIEIKQGLSPGAEYVTKNSFVVKADAMKSGAAHEH